MSFINNITTFMQEKVNAPYSYRAVIYGDIGAYFESVKGIKSYQSAKIILLTKNGEITVVGENLCIKSYYGEDIMISGKILGWSIA